MWSADRCYDKVTPFLLQGTLLSWDRRVVLAAGCRVPASYHVVGLSRAGHGEVVPAQCLQRHCTVCRELWDI